MGTIHVTHEQHFSVVTLNDAARYNTMRLSMWIELRQAMLCIADGDTSQISRIDQAVDTCFKSSDCAEGRKAFAQKRLPKFTGH